MFLAGSNFVLSYFAFKGKIQKIIHDEEFKLYFKFIIVFTVIAACIIYFRADIAASTINHPMVWGEAESAFRHGLFQVISVITTTGFVTADFTMWTPFLVVLFFGLMFLGGSAGSTSGGVKVVRHLILIKNGFLEFKRTLHPNAIVPVRYNKRSISGDIVFNVLAFFILYMLSFIIGALVFGFAFNKKQFIGIFIGLIGTLILILKGADLNPNQNYWYALLPIISSVGYAFNVNIIKKHLHDLDGLTITTGHFLIVIIPVLIILGCTGFFTEFELNSETKPALFYIIILALLGTAMAKVIFNDLVHISSPIFASSVTYLIPIIAVMWGIIDGEQLSVIQLLAGGIILFGVWMVNKAK